MNNEAYASQYLDHFIAQHRRMNFILMSRQNLPQRGAHPWTAHGCLEGAAGFATDFRQLMGPAYRDADCFQLPFGTSLPSNRLQYETACAALQSEATALAPGAATYWTFFGFYLSDHPMASSDADLAVIDVAEHSGRDLAPCAVALSFPTRSLLHDAPAAVADPLDKKAIRARYRRRTHVEQVDGQLLSFFTPGKTHSRHIVLREKERAVARRHGALLLTSEEIAAHRSNLVRHLLDARRFRRAAHHRQHVFPQALFCFARSLQHHPRQRTTHARGNAGWMAVADCAIRIRDWPQRLSLDLSTRRPNDYSLGGRFRRTNPRCSGA